MADDGVNAKEEPVYSNKKVLCAVTEKDTGIDRNTLLV